MFDFQPIRWSFKPSQATFDGRVLRIAIYLQCKVVEIIDSNNSVFHLLYFKKKLLGGGNIEQLKEGTFLHTAFQHGILIPPTHPLFSLFLPHNRKANIPEINTLFTELQNHFSLEEIALSATFMDSFIDKQQLIRVMREIFSHFKRSGQFQKAYQTSQILLQFSPNIKAMKELTRDPEFEKYRRIGEFSPLWLESTYFNYRYEKGNEVLLQQLLKQHSRHLERLALFIDTFEVKHEFYDYQEFIDLVHHELSPEHQYATLKYLWEISPNHPLLIEDLLQEQIRSKLYPEAITLIANQTPIAPIRHREWMEGIIDELDPSSLSKVSNINNLISQLYVANPEKKEKLVRQITISLLKEWDTAQLRIWLKPIEETTPDLPVIDELAQLESLSNDLNQLMKLGEVYYHFGLLDQSIECFTWETELQPDSLDPVRWLSKLYQEKGMVEEAEGYKKLSILMAKRENS